MKTIYLLSCCKQKLSVPSLAIELYQSTGFKKSLNFALSKKPDAIHILSAKHHVVDLYSVLEPYDECLSFKPIYEQKKWAEECINSLSQKYDLKNDKFIILAGSDYYRNLIGPGKIEIFELPLKGLSQGYRLQWFDENTITVACNDSSKQEVLCDKIHEYANNLKRFSYPFNSNELPDNGIYIMFEKGERYKNWDRIVRVGTCTGEDNLSSRLEQHFVFQNKDRSIFIKNIGRAILNKEKDNFLSVWNLDFTTRAAREEYADSVDFEKIARIEKAASEYIRNNISFVVLPIDKKDERLSYEKFLISSVSANIKCSPSENWLGNYSPEEKIRKSGMWLKQGLANSSNYLNRNKGKERINMNFGTTNFEKICNCLAYKQNDLCDDCITLLSGVSPRQQVNQICNLRHKNLINTKHGICSHCGKSKLIRSVDNSNK